jgi:hypothetical protein
MRERCCNVVLVLFTVVFVACKGEHTHDEHHEHEVPECIEYELDSCVALYPATYDEVWTQTVENSCATQGTACHAGAESLGAEHGGLTFADPQATWEHLMAEELVVPGDPLCSPLFVRLATDDPEILMPPGSSGLSPTAVCSIGTWIADGAEYVAP